MVGPASNVVVRGNVLSNFISIGSGGILVGRQYGAVVEDNNITDFVGGLAGGVACGPRGCSVGIGGAAVAIGVDDRDAPGDLGVF